MTITIQFRQHGIFLVASQNVVEVAEEDNGVYEWEELEAAELGDREEEEEVQVQAPLLTKQLAIVLMIFVQLCFVFSYSADIGLIAF